MVPDRPRYSGGILCGPLSPIALNTGRGLWMHSRPARYWQAYRASRALPHSHTSQGTGPVVYA